VVVALLFSVVSPKPNAPRHTRAASSQKPIA
jgi:hypothetical protein